MARKFAIFVEGQTERVFLSELITNFSGNLGVEIVEKRLNGGRRFEKIFIEIDARKIGSGQNIYILIIDCGSNDRVLSEIRDQYESLIDAGYDKIIGLRDVYPLNYNSVKRIKEGMLQFLPKVALEVQIYLSVMEIETWFLAEQSHFLKFNRKLTPKEIESILGFKIIPSSIEKHYHPSESLDKIYNSIGIKYDKSLGLVNRIVQFLDMDYLDTHISLEVKHLGYFISGIKDILSEDHA